MSGEIYLIIKKTGHEQDDIRIEVMENEKIVYSYYDVKEGKSLTKSLPYTSKAVLYVVKEVFVKKNITISEFLQNK